MTPDEIKANLTAEQWQLYESAVRCIEAADDIIGEQWGREIESKAVIEKDFHLSVKTALEDLAERNQLLDECLEYLPAELTVLRAAIAAALKGVAE